MENLFDSLRRRKALDIKQSVELVIQVTDVVAMGVG
jgi:hypothetical protein